MTTTTTTTSTSQQSLGASTTSISSLSQQSHDGKEPPPSTTSKNNGLPSTSSSSLFARKLKRRPKTAGDTPTPSAFASFESSRANPLPNRDFLPPGRLIRHDSDSANRTGSSQTSPITPDSSYASSAKHSSSRIRGYRPGETMHESISSLSDYSKPKISPTSDAASTDAHLSIDGLGISNLLDAFPLPEEEEMDCTIYNLAHYPLPIRLGLMRPSQLNKSAQKRLYREAPFATIEPAVEMLKRKTPAQYCRGYFLSTPPPKSKEERSMTSPDLLQTPHGNTVDRQADVAHRYEASRRLPTGRGRAISDVGSAELSRRSLLMKSRNNESNRRWKLEQYFRSYQRKTCTGMKSYKFHAYSPEEACYWWSYSVKTLVAESLTHNLITSVANLTVLDWSQGPPSRVLDIGTGSGCWVVDMAKKWTEAEFIGLDLVPCQTPLTSLGDGDCDLQSRVSWVVANALQGLPFPDNSFDFVHIRLMNTGVPEDKWELVLSEAIRVLTPNGSLEILEANWCFLGSPKDILTCDLQDLAQGTLRQNNEKIQMWNRKYSNRYSDLEAAVGRMLTNRLVKTDPASIIPFHLMNLEVTQLSQGKPRTYPILARSSTYLSNKNDLNKQSTISSQVATWSSKGASGPSSFTTRQQIGLPLPPHEYKVDNLEVLRMAILVGDITRTSESRDAIWEEIQRNNKATNGDEGSFVCPWKHKGEFDREMDIWCTDMMARADLENLLKSTINWDEAASRMDTRFQLDRESRRERKRQASGQQKEEDDTLNALPSDKDSSFLLQDSPKKSFQSLSNSSEVDPDEDRSTIRDQTPTPLSSFAPTTAVLAFRTTTSFGAKKKVS